MDVIIVYQIDKDEFLSVSKGTADIAPDEYDHYGVKLTPDGPGVLGGSRMMVHLTFYKSGNKVLTHKAGVVVMGNGGVYESLEVLLKPSRYFRDGNDV